MITRTPDATAPYFDVADPAFCVTSAEVRRAREAGWYARTSYGLAVLRYDQVSRLVRHPSLRQGAGGGPPTTASRPGRSRTGGPAGSSTWRARPITGCAAC